MGDRHPHPAGEELPAVRDDGAGIGTRLPSPGLAILWLGLPAGALALAMADAPVFGGLDPGALTSGLQVSVALFVFPFAAPNRRPALLALACALLGAPTTVLAEGLAGRSPFSLAAALPPLALLAAASRGGRSGRERPSAGWLLGAALVAFGLPWLEYLARDFGAGAVLQIGALSPVLPGDDRRAAAALLAAVAIAGALAVGGRRGS